MMVNVTLVRILEGTQRKNEETLLQEEEKTGEKGQIELIFIKGETGAYPVFNQLPRTSGIASSTKGSGEFECMEAKHLVKEKKS